MLVDIAHSGTSDNREIALRLARYALVWPVPEMALSQVHVFAAAYHTLQPLLDHKVEPDGRNLPGLAPHIIYVLFSRGRYRFIYDRLPEDVLRDRGKVLFWIDHSKPEWRSRGRQLDKGDALPPKAESMLRFLCRAENAGQTVNFSDLATAVWGPDALRSPEAIQNNVQVQQTAIKTFAAEPFIVMETSRATHEATQVLRLRGKDAYRIGLDVPMELCIVEASYRQ